MNITRYHLYAESNKNDTITYKTETNSWISKSNLQLPKGKLYGRGINQGAGINEYTLIDIKQVTNKICSIAQGNLPSIL